MDVLVTGATGGIGAQTARQLASKGHRLALLDLPSPALEELTTELDAIAAPCDVTDTASTKAAVEGAIASLGGLDVVLAGAGIAPFKPLRRTDPAVLADVLEVNVVGAWRTIHPALDALIARRGYVLVIASAAAIIAPPGLGAYGASKAGVENLCDTLRVELSPHGVDVGVAYFSWIDTDMVGSVRANPGYAAMRDALQWPTSQELPATAAADALVKAIEQRARRVVAPPWVRAANSVRGFKRALERDMRRAAADVERLTP
jgi:NAD(P)-dependent dehydrogenase (short-subunit alcohol dehydrogenase family)